MIAALAAFLVFKVWYPFPYLKLSGGREIFSWLVLVDIVIGPLITLLIFNIKKSRSHLIIDFTILGLLQIAALSYGLWTMFVARPVHLVFEYQRMAVVHAIDVQPELLPQAPPGLQTFSLVGPTLLSLRPLKASEFVDSTMKAMGGTAQAAQPNLWQPYNAARSEILHESRPLTQLKERFASQTAAIDQAVVQTGLPAERLRTLPLLARKDAWTVLIDAETTLPVGYLPLDSF